MVYLPLWKIWVTWDDDIPNIWKIKNVPNHTSQLVAGTPGERDLKTPTWPTLATATLATGATGRTAGRSSGVFRAGDAAGSLWAATAMAADAFSTARTIIYGHVLVLEPHGAANMFGALSQPANRAPELHKWSRLGGQNVHSQGPDWVSGDTGNAWKWLKMPAIGMFNPCLRHFSTICSLRSTQCSSYLVIQSPWWLNPFLFNMFKLAQHPLNYQKNPGEWRPSPWFTMDLPNKNWASPLLTAQPVISIQIHFVKGVGQRGPLHLGRWRPEGAFSDVGWSVPQMVGFWDGLLGQHFLGVNESMKLIRVRERCSWGGYSPPLQKTRSWGLIILFSRWEIGNVLKPGQPRAGTKASRRKHELLSWLTHTIRPSAVQ